MVLLLLFPLWWWQGVVCVVVAAVHGLAFTVFWVCVIYVKKKTSFVLLQPTQKKTPVVLVPCPPALSSILFHGSLCVLPTSLVGVLQSCPVGASLTVLIVHLCAWRRCCVGAVLACELWCIVRSSASQVRVGLDVMGLAVRGQVSSGCPVLSSRGTCRVRIFIDAGAVLVSLCLLCSVVLAGSACLGARVLWCCGARVVALWCLGVL